MTPFDGKFQTLQKTPTHFYASSHCFRDDNIFSFLPSKVDQGHGAQFSRLHHLMVCKNLQMNAK